MRGRIKRSVRFVWRVSLVILFGATSMGVSSLRGQSASELPVSEAEGFLGNWTLQMDFQGNPVEMTLRLSDVDGKVAAQLESARQPEPQVITRISREDDFLKLEWERDFGGQSGTLALEITRTSSGLTGTLGDNGGFFTAELTGVAQGEAAPATARGGDSDSDRAARARARRRRRAGATASLTLDGNKIEIGYAELKQDSEDFGRLAELQDGEVFKFVSGRAVKLKTDASLRFGDVLIKHGNAAENYPGVYSLWLKKAGEGWNLVFNEHADIWGTQYLNEADVAEVPIDRTGADTQEPSFKVELLEVGDGALLRLAWGPHQWLAPFELVR